MRGLARYLPILGWLPAYRRGDLPGDLMAGIIVAIVLVPQGMAYAMLANLPPEIGLYAGLVPPVLYGIFGSSRALAVGPVAIMSLMTASATAAYAGSAGRLEVALVLALISGLLLLAMGLLRLGFLADISPDDIDVKLRQVLAGDYTIEEHFLLEGEVSVNGGKEVPCALNEVLIHSAQMPRMLEFDLYVDGDFVYNQHSDGLIISSPTGSTAYSLSAGGPIMHPSLDAIVLVPMFPHSLNSRPLVIPGAAEIKIVIGSHIGTNAKISFDSQVEFEISPGDSLLVRKKREKLKLIHPPGHNFYGVCRSKLDWASRLGDS